MACSLFVSTDGLQSGTDAATDASFTSDVAANDSGITDSASSSDVVVTKDAGPPAGPIAFVQTTDSDPPDAGSGDMTFGNPVTPGNTILVAIVFHGTATAGVTDDQNDAFHLDVGPIGAAEGDAVTLFSVIGAKGNERIIHVSITGGTAQYTELYAMEYSGIAAFDTGAGNTASSSGTINSGYVTTAVANELLIGFAIDETVTAASNCIARNTANDDLIEDRFADAPGVYSLTATMTGDGDMLIGAYR
jgi:hypothetical protein